VEAKKGCLDDTRECHSYLLLASITISGSNAGLSQNMRLLN
jgi:hypothetical protein